MEYIYLLVTLAAGIYLYRRHPGAYIGFAWWLWFLTPEARRLVDYVQGWNPVNPMMLAPYLVSGLTFFTLVYHLPKLRLNRFFPFAMIFLSLAYAYAVGILHTGLFSATYALIEWTVPVMFGFYLVVNWRMYPVHRRAILGTFLLGTLVISAYGVFQFFSPPPWDTYWMLSSGMISVGDPNALEVRIFSTLNSPSPFGTVMMAGLLLLLSRGGSLRWPVTAVGYTAFLLSLSRQSWGGWAVGLLFMIVRRGRASLGLLLTLMAVIVVALPLLTVGPVAERINERLQTLTAIEQDRSFQARVELYNELVPEALFNPVGEGLGSTGLGSKLNTDGAVAGDNAQIVGVDSGVLEIPYDLGWPGSALYVGGLIWLLYYAFRSRNSDDFFAVGCCGIVIGMLAQLPFNDKTDGLPGMLLWSFICLAIAAETYRTQESKNDGVEPKPDGQRGGRYPGSQEAARKGVAGRALARDSRDLPR